MSGWAGLVRRALAGHAAVGLLAAGLLYVIALTGTLAVIHERWQRWEQPVAPELTQLSPASAQAAVAATLRAARASRPARIAIQLPSEDLPRATLTTDAGSRYLDAAGRVLGATSPGWAEFVSSLHETLLLPTLWGYALVGALGVALASLALTGVLAHPRILRDAFRLRWRQGPPIARVDWHNRLGVWTLPFALAVALTGGVLGLGVVGFAVLADAYHGGSLERAYAPLFGRAPPVDARAGPLPRIDTALLALRVRRPDAEPATVTMQAPGTRGQEILILAVHPHRLIYGETYRFDALGRPLGKVGTADGAIGQQAVASVYGLHFGSYAGLPMRLAYLVFGTALCVVIATGPSIWLSKRRRRGLGGPRLPACWNAVVWGAPLLLIVTAWLRIAVGSAGPLGPVFWLGFAALLATALVRPGLFGASACRGVTLAATIGTGLAHLLLARPPATASQAIDVALCLGAGVTLWIMRRRPEAQTRSATR